MKIYLLLLCSVLSFACLAADKPEKAPNLLKLSSQQLLEVCENKHIGHHFFDETNKYYYWSLKDCQHVLGTLYLALYEKGIKLDRQDLFGKRNLYSH